MFYILLQLYGFKLIHLEFNKSYFSLFFSHLFIKKAMLLSLFFYNVARHFECPHKHEKIFYSLILEENISLEDKFLLRKIKYFERVGKVAFNVLVFLGLKIFIHKVAE